MHPLQIVIDTNVFIAALCSEYGAAHRLFLFLENGKFDINFSVPLLFEYESTAKREIKKLKSYTENDIEKALNYLCSIANLRNVYYLWRPLLRDPKDDMVLELAVAAGCNVIVSYNKKDFAGADWFGIRILTPKEFLREIGEYA